MLVVLPRHAHADVVQKRSGKHGENAVLEGSDTFGLEAHGNTRFAQQIGELQGVLRDHAHVHGAVVIVPEALYAHHVRVLLQRLQLIILQNFLSDS